MFHAWAFDDIMNLMMIKYLKKIKFDYPKNEKNF